MRVGSALQRRKYVLTEFLVTRTAVLPNGGGIIRIGLLTLAINMACATSRADHLFDRGMYDSGADVDAWFIASDAKEAPRSSRPLVAVGRFLWVRTSQFDHPWFGRSVQREGLTVGHPMQYVETGFQLEEVLFGDYQAGDVVVIWANRGILAYPGTTASTEAVADGFWNVLSRSLRVQYDALQRLKLLSVGEQAQRTGMTAANLSAQLELGYFQRNIVGSPGLVAGVHVFATLDVGGVIAPDRNYIVNLVLRDNSYGRDWLPETGAYHIDFFWERTLYWGDEAISLLEALRKELGRPVSKPSVRLR